jgi:hypothetical protein
MPIIHSAESVVHEMHGTSFTSYASPERGSRELCAWRIEIPGGTEACRTTSPARRSCTCSAARSGSA